MKRIILLIVFLMASAPARAATTATVAMTINVPVSLELTAHVWRVPAGISDPSQGAEWGTMDFGPLRYNQGFGWWAADVWFCVFLYPNASGDHYMVTQQCSDLVFPGSSQNLSKKLILTPAYCGADQWESYGSYYYQGELNTAAGDYVGGEGVSGMHSTAFTTKDGKTFHSLTARPRVSANWHPVFNSASGEPRIIRAYYGFYTADPDMKKEWGLPIGLANDRDGLIQDTDLTGISWANGNAKATGTIVFTITNA